MKMKYKLPFTIASSTLLVAAPVALTVSCSNDQVHQNVSGTYLVTNGESINSNSVNRMTGDALASILGVDSINSNDYINPGTNFTSSYRELESNGAKMILAPGSNQAAEINNYFLSNPDSELNFMLIDGDYKSQNFVNQSNVASIKFDVKQPAFLAGVLTSKYLSSIDDKNPKVGMFAKDDSQTSTDYMIGFASGIKYANNLSSTDTDVEFVLFNDDASYTNGNIEANLNTLIRNQTDVILPVVGDEINKVVDIISNNYDALDNKTKLIGTETDQSAFLPQKESELFLTSIEKKVHKATLDVYRKIINNDSDSSNDISGPELSPSVRGLGELTTGNLDNSLVKISTPGVTSAFDLYKEIIGVSGTTSTLDAAKNNVNYFTDFNSTITGLDKVFDTTQQARIISQQQDISSATAEQVVVNNLSLQLTAGNSETLSAIAHGTPLTDELASKFGITKKDGYDYSIETTGFTAASTSFEIVVTVVKNGQSSTVSAEPILIPITRVLSPSEVDLDDVFAEYDRVVELLKTNTIHYVSDVPRQPDQTGSTFGYVRLNGPDTDFGPEGHINSAPSLVDALGLIGELDDNYYYDLWITDYAVGQTPTFYLVVILKSDWVDGYTGNNIDGATSSGLKLNTRNTSNGRADTANVAFQAGSVVVS